MRVNVLATALAALPTATAIALNLNDQQSIINAANTVAYRMMTYYNGNETGGIPGELPQSPVKYYWWETGEMFMSLIDHYWLTNDSSYNDVVMQGMLFQTGTNDDYMPLNQTVDLGNDDQVFWGFAAMTAAELNFPNPPSDQPQWLALAQAVFNTQALRWDTSTCNGGLRWQIFSFNPGYNYKNSPSNVGFFNLAARLGAYTHNTSYTNWAEKAWDWTTGVNLTENGHVYDGTDDTENCTSVDHIEWTYSSGMALHGAAAMYAQTNSSVWQDRVNQIWSVSKSVFFLNNVMSETACEQNNPVNCDTDQLSFKSTYSRFLAATTKYCPWLASEIMPLLASSAQAAAAQCTGQPGGDSCGTLWTNNGTWDGSTGVGQQMSALQVIQANLVASARSPVTNGTGGTSQGNPAAGVSDANPTVVLTPITTGDRAGAGILTGFIIIATLGLVWYTLADEYKFPMTRKA